MSRLDVEWASIYSMTHSFNFDIQLAVLKYSSRSRMGSNQKIEDESTFQRNETSLNRLTTLSFDRVP